MDCSTVSGADKLLQKIHRRDTQLGNQQYNDESLTDGRIQLHGFTLTDQAASTGLEHRLGTVTHLQLAVDITNMDRDGLLRNIQ